MLASRQKNLFSLGREARVCDVVPSDAGARFPGHFNDLLFPTAGHLAFLMSGNQSSIFVCSRCKRQSRPLGGNCVGCARFSLAVRRRATSKSVPARFLGKAFEAFGPMSCPEPGKLFCVGQ